MKVLEETRGVDRIAATNGIEITKIIVAVDLSPHSEKTATYGAEFAKKIGASVTLVHVFPPEPHPEFASEGFYESLERGRRLMVGKLTKLVEQVRATGIKCDYDFRIGDPAEEVTRAAQELHADLIISATHHPGWLGRFFGLDQAPRILHRAGCPILVYHDGNE
jgi:nucleotide-binding universal stress UspA family protein